MDCTGCVFSLAFTGPCFSSISPTRTTALFHLNEMHTLQHVMRFRTIPVVLAVEQQNRWDSRSECSDTILLPTRSSQTLIINYARQACALVYYNSTLSYIETSTYQATIFMCVRLEFYCNCYKMANKDNGKIYIFSEHFALEIILIVAILFTSIRCQRQSRCYIKKKKDFH